MEIIRASHFGYYPPVRSPGAPWRLFFLYHRRFLNYSKLDEWTSDPGVFSDTNFAHLSRFYRCLVVMRTALGCSGISYPGTILASFSPVRFFLNTVFLYLPGMDGVFAHKPVLGALNGSAWTIKYDFIGYILIALLGTLGILRRRNLILGLFGISLPAYVLQLGGILSVSDLSGQGKIGLINGSWTYSPQFSAYFLQALSYTSIAIGFLFRKSS